MTAFARCTYPFRFMKERELTFIGAEPSRDRDEPVLEIHQADFAWDDAPGGRPTLRDINLSIKRGQLVAIVGPVSSRLL
jgi:ABC-type multidrug transport system fused ATPase/permease subunit